MIGRGRNLSEPRSSLKLEVRSSGPRRLDSWLVESMAWKSRNRLQRLIRDGHVTINGEVAKASRRVRAGDVVEMRLSDGVGIPQDYAERELEVVYEDDWLIAINKPPGMLVHPVGRHVYDTLINYLHYRYHQPGDDGEEIIPRLCHRLDKDTTGLVVVGKNTYTHREVMYQFENRRVSKRYLTIVEGRFPEDIDRIDVPIGEGRCLKSALEHEVLKPSETLVEVVATHGDFTVLRCVPSTGRQNQIRIHLAARGHPVVGDLRYGARETRGMATRKGWPSRYLLHSEYLRFWHPRLKTAIELHSAAPEDFRSLL